MNAAQRLYELERRLSALENAPPPPVPDQLSPSYITFNPDGSINATFNGLVVGSVVLPEGAGSVANLKDALMWTADGTPTGSLTEWLVGWASAGTHHLLGAAGGQSVQIIGSDGISDFLQTAQALADVGDVIGARNNLGLGSAATRKLFATSVSLTFTASTKAGEVNIIHNLGAIPAAIVATPLGDPGRVIAPYAKNLGSTTTATIGAYTGAAVSATASVGVLVIA